jgi:hypothetical protein
MSNQVTYRLLATYKVVTYDIAYIVLNFQLNGTEVEVGFPIRLVRGPFTAERTSVQIIVFMDLHSPSPFQANNVRERLVDTGMETAGRQAGNDPARYRLG